MNHKILFSALLSLFVTNTYADANYVIRHNVNGLINTSNLPAFNEDGINRDTGTEFDQEGRDVNGNYEQLCLPFNANNSSGTANFTYLRQSISNTATYTMVINWDGTEIIKQNVRYRTTFPMTNNFLLRTISPYVTGGYTYTHSSSQENYIGGGANYSSQFSLCRQRISD